MIQDDTVLSELADSLVIDVDTGRDDAWLILGAMRKNLVAAVVATYGNVALHLAEKNSLDVVALGESVWPSVNDCHEPVWTGSEAPLVPPSPAGLAEIKRRSNINGNGLCNLVLPTSEDRLATRSPEWAAELTAFIKGKGQVDYIVAGPMTNLARLIDVFDADEHGKPSILKYINRVVAMGGSFDPKLPVDFNFIADPLAAQKVVDVFGKKLTLVPFDETLKLRITENEITKLIPTDNAALFSRELMLAHARGWSADRSIMLHDPATLLAFKDAKTITLKPEKVRIALDGQKAGKVLSDPSGTEVMRMSITPGSEKSVRDDLLRSYLGLSFGRMPRI